MADDGSNTRRNKLHPGLPTKKGDSKGGNRGSFQLRASQPSQSSSKSLSQSQSLNEGTAAILAQPSVLGGTGGGTLRGEGARRSSFQARDVLSTQHGGHANPRVSHVHHAASKQHNGGLVARLNQNPTLEKIGKTVRGSKVQSVTFMSVMWALFAQDICFGWIMDKDVDSIFSIVTVIVFIILALEMTCHMFLTVKYFGSYFMFIDLVGTALLIPEIFIYNSSDNQYSSDNAEDNILSVARAGRVARTAAMVRIGRIAKIFRVLRTARAMQCLLMFFSMMEAWKKRQRKAKRAKKRRELEDSIRERSEAEKAQAREKYAAVDVEDEDDSFDTKPSVFGLKYANLVSQRVVIGVLLILAVVPQLEVQELDYSREASMDHLQLWGASCTDSGDSSYCTDVQMSAATQFLDKFPDCLYLNNFGSVLKNDEVILNDRRKVVMTKYTAAASDDPSTWTDANSIIAIFDDQEVETQVRIMNILLTLFVVMIFSAGSWIFNNDAKTMIIRPIERLTKLVKKLAGMVFMLSAEEEEGSDGLSEGNEMNFIDLIADKMDNVFADDDKLKKKASKHANKLVPSELSPKTNHVGLNARVHTNGSESDSSMHEMNAEELIQSRPELKDLNYCLNNQKARSYFRLFLSREFNVENISFWEAVQEYKVQFKKKAKFIYTTYISQAAMSQVNIPAAQRAMLKEMVTQAQIQCDAEMYDKAQEEIFRLMSRDPFPRFLKSDLAVTYAKIARENDKVIEAGKARADRELEDPSLRETLPPPETSTWRGHGGIAGMDGGQVGRMESAGSKNRRISRVDAANMIKSVE
ncbi:hypothetical protein TrVE_jg337 [Triparma verrucosa]|uniref:RGS domain-containing protein n=1 Tax=Triparma verrucosa TaxID=1606542 RepID=A0A9W7C7V7_9STRA|nr:hypothetical protein TrVE_jg337 [Triparma verrucosa]